MEKKTLYLFGLIALITVSGIMIVYAYHTNKPLEQNVLREDFEDQLAGAFPIGWYSGVHPLNVKVKRVDDNNVMEVKDTTSEDVTEIVKKFKKTTKGEIQCDLFVKEKEQGFFLHLTQIHSDYNPYDDLIIGFLNEEIYVIGENGIISLQDNGESIYLIDEWNIEDATYVGSYDEYKWVTIRIVFDSNNFFIYVDGQTTNLEGYSYPQPTIVSTSHEFCHLYFWTFIESSGFEFYVDNIEIKIGDPVVDIHPLNAMFLTSFLFLGIGIFALILKLKGKL